MMGFLALNLVQVLNRSFYTFYVQSDHEKVSGCDLQSKAYRL